MVDNEIYNLFIKYGIALSNLEMQVNTIFQELSKLGENNPIEHHKSRIKSATSIEEKLNKYVKEKGQTLEFNAENIETYLSDVVGIRIVCPFLSDVYTVIDIIKKCFDVEVIEEKDYIKHPKTSGYSSYHMKILVPIKIPNSNKIEKVKAEIQIRTITMDVVASLEHKIFYKKNVVLLDEMQDKLDKITYYCNCVEKDLNDVLVEERSRRTNSNKRTIIPSFISSSEFGQYIKNNQKALSIVEDKIKQISDLYVDAKEINPIEHIKCRIKTKDRIIEKLKRQNKKITFENVKEHINDIAGIRIVCSFIDDVEEVINRIKEDPTLEIIEEQDYLTSPKENGYSSYHILVKVPIVVENKIEYQKVEIQIRTMPQEMWAILEERLCYQKEVNQSITDDLKRLSNVIADVDYNMNEMIRYSKKQQKKDNIKKKILN